MIFILLNIFSKADSFLGCQGYNLLWLSFVQTFTPALSMCCSTSWKCPVQVCAEEVPGLSAVVPACLKRIVEVTNNLLALCNDVFYLSFIRYAVMHHKYDVQKA